MAKRLKLRYAPVAILFTDEKPAGALEFAEGRWGCTAAMLTAAAKGRTAVFSRATCGCAGGRVGLGLSDRFAEGMEYFLSTGKEGMPRSEAYKKTPELAREFMDSLPKTSIPEKYVVFTPLSEIAEDRTKPEVVVFYVNPDQLSGMVVLANYGRAGNDNVEVPFGAGCHTFCLIPWSEKSKERPKAVIGMLDVSARPHIDADLLSFSMPYAMFKEMEANLPGSFFDKHDWAKLAERIK